MCGSMWSTPLTRLLTLLATLLFALPAASDTAGPFTGGLQTDLGTCRTNDASHAVIFATDSLRVDGFCVDVFRVYGFGITTGDIEAGSTIDGITLRFIAHGGSATEAVRRRVDVWIVDAAATNCTTGGAPGRNDHQLNQGADLDVTWTGDDVADVLWGCTGWNVGDADSKSLNDVDFGIRWAHTTDTGPNSIGIDFVTLTIEYTPPSAGRRRAIVIGEAKPGSLDEVSLAFAEALP